MIEIWNGIWYWTWKIWYSEGHLNTESVIVWSNKSNHLPFDYLAQKWTIFTIPIILILSPLDKVFPLYSSGTRPGIRPALVFFTNVGKQPFWYAELARFRWYWNLDPHCSRICQISKAVDLNARKLFKINVIIVVIYIFIWNFYLPVKVLFYSNYGPVSL